MGAPEVPTWATWHDAWHVVRYRWHLLASIKIALVVGTVLFAINQLDVVVRGDGSTSTWIKSAVTYFVPFAVSNLAILSATRRHT